MPGEEATVAARKAEEALAEVAMAEVELEEVAEVAAVMAEVGMA